MGLQSGPIPTYVPPYQQAEQEGDKKGAPFPANGRGKCAMRLKAAHRIRIRQGDAKGYYSPWQRVQALLDRRRLYPSNREGILSDDIPLRQEDINRWLIL